MKAMQSDHHLTGRLMVHNRIRSSDSALQTMQWATLRHKQISVPCCTMADLAANLIALDFHYRTYNLPCCSTSAKSADDLKTSPHIEQVPEMP